MDLAREKILLVSHIKAGLWLPSGGHVEQDEHPKLTAERELAEELNLLPEFLSEAPLFLTQTVTVGQTAAHTDVSLWYVLKGDSREELVYDQTEFNGYRWFGYDEILQGDPSDFDPHMNRFIRKLLESELLKVSCLS
ncbi:MAG: NUDIX domain-containing protein [Chlamydiia bacterium]